jgi:endonuclease YncB( thermonuclease family)
VWLALCLLLLPLVAAARTETATVRHVVDGDSVILADDRQVRLIGINTPELGRDGAPDQPLARAARDRLRELVQGKTVRLTFESESRDRHGRWLAHVALTDGRSAETDLLENGLAWAVAIPPNIGEHARHRAAEAGARRARRGVWGHSYYVARDPATLTSSDTGFRQVRGRVTHVGRSRKYVYLDMAARFALRISHADWAQYFGGRAEDWHGVVLEARGWIADHDGRLHMTIGHPAMIERLL